MRFRCPSASIRVARSSRRPARRANLCGPTSVVLALLVGCSSSAEPLVSTSESEASVSPWSAESTPTEVESELASRAGQPFVEPDWWHHYHADSRNSDRVASIRTGAKLEEAWRWQTGTAAFNGAALSKDQSRIYVTASEDYRANFFALDRDAPEPSRVAWTFDALDEWATFSSALVDRDDTVYVSDKKGVYALTPPRKNAPASAQPIVKWSESHDDVSMSLGFTPTGELFEVTISGTVNIYKRGGGRSESHKLASAKLKGSRFLPPGVGLPETLRESKRAKELAKEKYGNKPAPCQTWKGPDGTSFEIPGHLVHMFGLLRQVGLQAGTPGLLETFLDTGFGGTFVSNTPSIARIDADVSRIFVPTVGAYTPPESGMLANRSDGACGNEYPVFGRLDDQGSDALARARGYYTGYLQVIDWNAKTRTLSVHDVDREADRVLAAPSGTSPAVSDPGPHGRRSVYLAGGRTLYAYDAGTLNPSSVRQKWAKDAGQPVGGSPTTFPASDVGCAPGGDGAVAVLTGFAGITMFCDRSTEALPHWSTNTVPLTKERQERLASGRPVTLATATSVIEAGGDHLYVQFTEGPSYLAGYEAKDVAHFQGYIPRDSWLAVIDNRTGAIVQKLRAPEAQVCDSTLGKDGWVYTIHTSAIDQLKHALYPKLFPRKPGGGVIAYRPIPTRGE